MFRKRKVEVQFVSGSLAPMYWVTRFPRLAAWRMRRVGLFQKHFGNRWMTWIPPGQIRSVSFSNL